MNAFNGISRAKSALAATALVCALVFGHAHQAAAYLYIHNEGEYVVQLPDAPVGTTIYADSGDKIPLLDRPPLLGTLGEYADFNRSDLDTSDVFNVHITFLKADRDFLTSLTKDKMYKTMKDAFEGTSLNNVEEHFSKGTDTLKWATMIGYSVDKSNNLHYNAAHYLAGTSTIELIKVSYSLDNKKYQEFYDQMLKSIRYTGK